MPDVPNPLSQEVARQALVLADNDYATAMTFLEQASAYIDICVESGRRENQENNDD